jgi:hypothetical protein
MRKVVVEVKVRLSIRTEEGSSVDDAVKEWASDSTGSFENGDVEDAEVLAAEVTDSR